ncbi:hypothetical protein [Acidisphaera sp. L21]|uniref:hypothetical protein n=1 Tax=Acidisphaera sp. L21 TaxID=1641851 RepID=UPI00131C8730|nr:hypothetical protein [Acidisphaera sp. L21]
MFEPKGDIDRYLELVRKAAPDARTWMAAHPGDPLDMLHRMKFEAVGYHPIDGRGKLAFDLTKMAARSERRPTNKGGL